jgi:hypothetical protein
MKKIMVLLCLVIFTGLIYGQTQRPVVIYVTGALPQDSLDTKKRIDDSSNATSGYTTLYQNGLKSNSASPTFTGTVTHTGNFISATSNGTPRVTVGTVAGTGSGNFVCDTASIGTATIATAKKLTHTGTFISDKNNGTARFTVGSSAGTGAGNFIADTATLGAVTVATAKTLIHTGTLYSDKNGGTPRVTVGTAAGTAAGNFLADTVRFGHTKIGGTSTTLVGIDSINITNDSLHIFAGGKTFGISAHIGE